MRLSSKHLKKIAEMEASGYVWLSHMNVNAQMRFRNRTKAGFRGFIKEDGLTFLTREVARAIEIGTKRKNAPKMTLTEQVEYLTTRLAAREEYIKELESRLGASKLQ